MGIKNYLKAMQKPEAPAPAPQPIAMTAQFNDSASQLGSGMTSMKSSLAPSIISGMSTPKKGYVEEIRHEVMCNYLYQQQAGKLWIDQREEMEQGVVIRRSRGHYVAAPPDLAYSRFAANCSALNVQSAMTVSSKMIKIFLECSPDAIDVPLRNGLRVQILPNLEDLKRARIHQCAAFIATEKLLVVWDDEARNLMARAQLIEDELMELVWKENNDDENEGNMADDYGVEIDEETGLPYPGKRPTTLMNTIYVSITLCVMIFFVGRIGDYIVIIDSDTEVPADCLLDAASEMELYPEVGIMQFSSGVMQVVHTYFENGITWFTNLIYTAIRYCVSNGDVAPFVGHNAILRWSAIQQVGHYDEDGYEKFWSESHVSEDFDMSLRLQCNGYIIRLAAWAGDGFKEGVSLTVYDELARWEKYAYGCNELLFNPVRYWLTRGPFTPLWREFLVSNIRFTSKITIVSYIGTYYAIGAAWLLTFLNYFIIGWFNGYLDHYYLDSWKVWFSIIIIFNGLGNIALAIMRYRSGAMGFFASLVDNFKWVPLLAIFLGGLSLHVSQALIAHMFEIDMQWGSTAKEAEDSNFFLEVPKVVKKFKFSMLWALSMFALMIIMAKAPFIPWDWRIQDFVAILPLASVSSSHFLMPIALNPALMTFTF